MDKAYLHLNEISQGMFSDEVYGGFVDSSNEIIYGFFGLTNIKQNGLEVSVLGFDNNGNARIVLPQNSLEGKHCYLVSSKDLKRE